MAAPALADRVLEAEPASGFDLYILSMYEKPGWRVRAAGDQVHAPHPGTAVSYGSALYEVMAVEPGAGAAYACRYALRKWDDRFVVRKIFTYSLETAAAAAAEMRQQAARHRRHAWLIYLFPLSGSLPTPLLRRWQREWGLPMRGASLASLVCLGIASLLALSHQFIGRQEPPSKTLLALLMFVALEEVVRFFWWLGASEAVGSLTITALWSVAAAVSGRDPDRVGRRRPGYDLAEQGDEVRHLKEQPWDLEVRSVFRDPALVGARPVRVEGEVYQPLECAQEGEGLYRRYVFRLKKLDGQVEAHREYRRERTPEQLRPLIAYEEARDAVHAWSVFYGLLPTGRQLKLERRYDLLSARATERSAMALLAASLLQLASLFAVRFSFAHLLAAYLAGESVYRFLVARSRGEPAGSLLGLLLGPFLRR